MAEEITLFDLPSKPPNRSWSLNPWKTRLVLHYKSLPYKTHWLEYPDVAPHLKSLSIAPNAEGTPYTIPTIHLPATKSHLGDEHIMDSKAIAIALEKLYPTPPLYLDAPELAKIEELWPQVMTTMRGVFMPKTSRTLLNDRSKEYFEETRKERFGMPLPDLEREVGGEQAWEQVRPILEAIGAVLKEKNGPFILGETVSYADFVLVSAMQYLTRLGGGLYERFVQIEPAFGRLYEASKQWLERDDH
ncbi:MAG: hypothetical protein Q9186_002862 [Xanthomendoza sp. 1 TL-2023]